MDQLESIRQEKMQELQSQFEAHQQEQTAQEEIQARKEAILKAVLTPEARARLTNLRHANPQLAAGVEALVIQLYQTGQLKRLDDAQLRAILARISSRKKETNITIKRK